jgi:DNA (cytosine-5)-methyltransferase 1
MSSRPLVLSLFPGIGLLDMAFDLEGFCVVRGPDVLWGGDVRRFHPPAGRFDGVIGGPPCQIFSMLRHLNPIAGQRHGNLIPEFERVVAESGADWFVMENVPDAPVPQPRGYWPAYGTVLNTRWLGEAQDRTRRFSFGTRIDGREARGIALDVSPDLVIFENPEYRQAITSDARAVPIKLGGSGKPKRTYSEKGGMRSGPACGPRASIAEMLRYQGLPVDHLDDAPFTDTAKRKVIGNGVPLPMGRAIARAVRRALGLPLLDTDRELLSP